MQVQRTVMQSLAVDRAIAAQKRYQILENSLVNMCGCLAASIIKPFSSKNVMLCLSELLTLNCRVKKAQISRKDYLYFAVSKLSIELPIVLKTDFER